MQSRGGGWGAFDKDNDKKLLTEDPVLRLRRGARPAVGRRHRACARSFRQARPAAQPPVHAARRSPISRREQEADGSVVRPLGRQLSLRHRRRAAGARRPRRGHARALYRPRLRLAGRASAGERRLGRKLRLLHGRQIGRPRRNHRLADRLGADGPHRRQPLGRSRRIDSGLAYLCSTRRRTAPGTSRISPAPASPATASARPSS